MQNNKKLMPEIIMHFGADSNTITIDGVVFDRNQMSHSEFSKLRKLVVKALSDLGLGKQEEKRSFRVYRRPYWQRARAQQRQQKRIRQTQYLHNEEGENETLH